MSGSLSKAPTTLSHRVILLGASNLMRGLPTALACARQARGEPLDVMAAAGHGRGYGSTCWVLGRTLPPILRCGLWRDLASRPAADTAALLTDVGNDLVYGATAEQIARWVRLCVERLQPHCRQITLTGLPLQRLRELTPRQFHICRRVLFPTARIEHETTLRSAAELDERLRELAEICAITFVAPRREWYGWDPIHVRRRQCRSAWHCILADWGADGAPLPHVPCWIRFVPPHERTIFGVQQRRAQPAGQLRDGTLLSFY